MTSGIFAIYKQVGPTSNQVLTQLKKITGEKKIGHAGTLDPLASGVLVIGIGREATKKLSEVVKKEKEYVVKIKLGEFSTTDDAEGQRQAVDYSNPPDKKDIELCLKSFLGKILQQPPVFSAIKINGRKAYKLARSGQKVMLEPRPVELKEAEVLDYSWPYLTLRLVTGSGFYVRSLAHDLGEKLGVGGYVAQLERTRVGDFTKDLALTVGDFFRKI